MNDDDISLRFMEVDCDGSACGSGSQVGLHVHPPQNGVPAIRRVVIRDSRRVGYQEPAGITRLVSLA